MDRCRGGPGRRARAGRSRAAHARRLAVPGRSDGRGMHRRAVPRPHRRGGAVARAVGRPGSGAAHRRHRLHRPGRRRVHDRGTRSRQPAGRRQRPRTARPVHAGRGDRRGWLRAWHEIACWPGPSTRSTGQGRRQTRRCAPSAVGSLAPFRWTSCCFSSRSRCASRMTRDEAPRSTPAAATCWTARPSAASTAGLARRLLLTPRERPVITRAGVAGSAWVVVAARRCSTDV